MEALYHDERHAELFRVRTNLMIAVFEYDLIDLNTEFELLSFYIIICRYYEAFQLLIDIETPLA
jgi:hypothetical protein